VETTLSPEFIAPNFQYHIFSFGKLGKLERGMRGDGKSEPFDFIKAQHFLKRKAILHYA
jgi:hypothetical protein